MSSQSSADDQFGVIVTDKHAIIQYVSPEFYDLTGYLASESVGRNCRFLQGGDTDRRAVDVIRDSIKNETSCRVALLNYKKDGSPFWNVLQISPILNAQGVVCNFVGVQMTARRSYVDSPTPLFPWISSEGILVPQEGAPPSLDGTDDHIWAERRFTPRITDETTAGDSSCSRRTRSALSFVAETDLPTSMGVYRLRAYRDLDTGREPVAIIHGNIECMQSVPLRVHDQCFTSEVLGSLKCDCKQQLEFAMDYIKESGPGIVIYLQQEGRGMGLASKVKAYSLQQRGFDTVDANLVLGFQSDSREYDVVNGILHELGIQSVKLMTNNPRKITLLRESGIVVEERIPVLVDDNEHSSGYMATKARRMGHLFTS